MPYIDKYKGKAIKPGHIRRESMTDRLAFSDRKTAYLLLEAGYTVEEVRGHLAALKPATKGYYYTDDVRELINSRITA